MTMLLSVGMGELLLEEWYLLGVLSRQLIVTLEKSFRRQYFHLRIQVRLREGVGDDINKFVALFQSRLGFARVYRNSSVGKNRYTIIVITENARVVQRALPYLWMNRQLLPTLSASLFCLKCGAWIFEHKLHMLRQGK